MGKYNPKQRRTEAIKEPRKVILILCEGAVTEEVYLEHFKVRELPFNIYFKKANHTNANGIVEEGKRLLREPRYGLPDEVLCVYDIDNNTPEQLAFAWNTVQSDNYSIYIFPSNPCIEIWFLLHFQDINSHLSSNEVLTSLKNFYPAYQKNADFLAYLVKKYGGDALNKIKQAYFFVQRQGIPEEDICKGIGISSTTMSLMIDHLIELKQGIDGNFSLDEYLNLVYRKFSL